MAELQEHSKIKIKMEKYIKEFLISQFYQLKIKIQLFSLDI